MKRLLTIQEVAGQLRVPVSTLYAWRTRRIGPQGIRVGRFVRYDQAAVDSWLEERLREETAP